MRALRVEIYKPSYGDCSNHGISSRFNEILLICPDGPIQIDESKPLPENLCKIVERDLGFCVDQHVEPVAKANGVGWMYGGCFVSTSDSRFTRLKGHYYPLRLHDRTETQAEYDMYSR